MPEDSSSIDYAMEKALGPHFSGLRFDSLRSSSPPNSSVSSPSHLRSAVSSSSSPAFSDPEAPKQPFVIGIHIRLANFSSHTCEGSHHVVNSTCGDGCDGGYPIAATKPGLKSPLPSNFPTSNLPCVGSTLKHELRLCKSVKKTQNLLRVLHKLGHFNKIILYLHYEL